jgi:formylglycine-generating enzyme required for sulfatase activity
MTLRGLLIGFVGLGAGSLMIGAFATATAQKSAARGELGSCAAYSGVPSDDNDHAGMAFIRGGTFVMGSERQRPEERFTHVVRVDGFWIDRHEVTNAQFREFVTATGYVTLAERGLDAATHPGMPRELLAPGSVVFIPPTNVASGGRITQWWQYVPGASWREPTGPGSSIAGKDNHPVVHIAYEDALAYARWRGRELPTEAQWEFAARGGRDGEDDWSSAFDAEGKPIANSWQGIFPVYNTNEDGYVGTAPVGCFKPNGYGDAAVNPRGPELQDLPLTGGQSPSRVIKGGSYLCASNYCARYRPAARQPQEVDLGAAHLGFRTILNRPDGETR